MREQRLRVFTDASSTGFGVVIYQCTYYIDDSVEVSFVVSKTSVAPLKQRTIPELELKGACVDVDLVKTVVTELSMNMRDVTFHTDSETELKWIQSKNGKLSVFVGNRIGKIRREIAVNQWHHIPGIYNPADWCSRGIDPTDVEALSKLPGRASVSSKQVAYSLSVDDFLICFAKFTSLRQRPQVIYSDNGTNLRAGKHELKEAVDEWIKKQDDIHIYAAHNDIE